MNTEYPLSGRLDYWRRETPEAALYAMFTHVSKRRRENGEACEFAFLYLTDEDYVGVLFMNGENAHDAASALKVAA